MGKPRDKFWDYAEVIPNEGEGKDKGTRWKCKFCNKKYSGGASRIKAHLAKVDREGIKVCEAVDEATTKEALEALDSNKRPKKKKRPDYLTDSTPMNPQEADLQSTLPVLGQRNLNGQLQRRPDEIQRVEFSGENESIDLANIPTRSDFGESTVGAMMQEFENEIQVEGPSDAQGYVNDWSGRERMLAPKLVGRDRIVDELWGYLTTNDILRIGVYGMGGVGKTTTMKHLYNKVHGSAAFENVFWITVSKDCSIHELQNKIARALKVPDLFKDVDEGMRPTLLCNYLSKKKKCLIILDDMWRHFELADVGIPVKRDGVQLVLTTRYRDVCEKMLCEAKIGVRPLSDEEAWALFVQTLDSDLPPSRKLVAEHIVKECKGLPLAIVVMAGSMRGEVEDHVWDATLENLKRPGVLEQSMKESVFPILVHSYNRLDRKKQLCFLTCALYPEDRKISRQELIELCIDEGVIYEDRRRKMYNEGHRLLDELEKSCLLEACSDGNGSKAVRIHDVIRDMALHIMNANNPPCMVKSGLGLEDVPDDEEWLLNLQKVSLMSNGIEAVPPSISPNCPQLATLLLSDCKRLHKISKRFFRRMQGLKVIDLRYTSITKVPKSVMSLKKLRALVLKCCFQLSRIPSLAKLTSLGKLDIEGCRKIKEVPDGLGMLVNLTYLGIHVSGIERIPDGVVCKLKKLQHLRADYVTVKGGEVGKLRKLEVLRCRFENVNELNEYTRHATTIESYILVIGGHPNCSYALNSGKVVIMDDVEIRETCQFPRDVKFLWILRVRTWNISSFTGLEELEVLRTEELLEEPEGQQEERTSPPPPGDHCPNLKVLQILDCPKLKHLLVSRHHCYLHLKKLEKLEIYHCEELESMIGAATDEEESLTSSTPPLPPDAFSQLQSIKIAGCPKMKDMVGPKSLPVLRKIELSGCAKMKRVLTLESFMLLPNLEKLEIDRCEELESIIDEEESLTSSTSPLPPDAFSQLQLIKLRWCHKMKRVLTPELFTLLPNLQTIIVVGCKEMKEVIGGQELDHGATSSLFLSPIPAASPGDQLSTRKLTLKLDDLEELESICSWTGLRDLIHVIQISRCPELKRIEMLDDASPPPSLKEIVLWVGGDGNRAKQWWESLEWEHPDAKNILEPYVFVDTPHRKKIPLRECRP
ncbi:probable disease resistance protein At1g61300 [Punica granatum]|uniref:Probable disease resistance protein At1g61300 n=1 Tax=Punica granatum TaxID=22663 RepID=A0A6P8CVP8_PUNGR|nr:probable disease resistance protein At1g61300 [Punica granatum]XP_031388878.1 probable disease resistance protein At1g61300 [Punica granatum]XP_031388879.1 probable disease resistance protein At1g61300 [Punica granatum]XP_031388880.1 probable disease resistance protein At1g61300 [Punica granatum]XP_031388881.1 probable disease resistance protein At1g61300 [Punica granatum]